MRLSYVVNCAADSDGAIAFWFEATGIEHLDTKELNIGYIVGGVQLHPFSWIAALEDSYLEIVYQQAVPESTAELRKLVLRLPVVSKGIPKPSPSNWIDLGENLTKKSGLETFVVPSLVFSEILSIAQISNFLDFLFDPELLVELSPQETPIRFVKSPSIVFLEQLLRLSESLLGARQFLPALMPTSSSIGWVLPDWRSVLGNRDAATVRTMVETGPAEFFSEVAGSRGGSVPSPMQLLHQVVDTLISSSIREAVYAGDTYFEYDSLHSKPLDDLVNSLIRPYWDILEKVSTRGRIPEILHQWRARVVSRLEPAHLALRISPPGFFDHPKGESDEWEVALGLAPEDDAEEFIDSESFSVGNPQLEKLQLTPASAELLFLRKLASAATHSPEISLALKSPHPTRFFLESDAVLDFVGHTAMNLAEIEGATLILPAVLKDSIRPRIKVTSSPSRSGQAMVGLETIFSFNATVYLGERQVNPDKIRELLKAKSPVVKVGSEWIFVDQDGLRKALRYLERHKNRQEMTLAELLGDTLDDVDLAGSVVVERPDPAMLIESLRLGRSMGSQSFIEPEGFALPLRDYQRRGVEWLASLEQVGLGACLADDMGLGKTVQIIALLAMEHQSKTSNDDASLVAQNKLGPSAIGEDGLVGTTATLIVAPVSVVNNWRREIERFYPQLRVHIHHGARRLDGLDFMEVAAGVEVVITSYSLLARDVGVLAAMQWNRVVLDEAQNVKNPSTAMAHAASSLKAFSRIALTGTPVENHTGELWSIMNFINPSMLGSRAGFRKRFSVPIERDGDDIVAQRLARAVSPFILRRLKTDKSIISDLPDKIEVKEYCGLSIEQLSLYQGVINQLRESLSDASRMQRRGAILASITRLKQICNHSGGGSDAPQLEGSSAKLDRLEELLDEILESGEKVIIFTQFAVFGALLQRHLQDRFARRVLFLSGDVPMARRDVMVSEFQGSDGPSIFILSLKAGGTGLNLTAANHVVHYDRWWNSAVETQATDRAFRIGQRKDVVVTKMICEGTLEERIDAIIESKRALAETLISGGETWITEMSDDEVFELLTLSSTE